MALAGRTDVTMAGESLSGVSGASEHRIDIAANAAQSHVANREPRAGPSTRTSGIAVGSKLSVQYLRIDASVTPLVQRATEAGWGVGVSTSPHPAMQAPGQQDRDLDAGLVGRGDIGEPSQRIARTEAPTMVRSQRSGATQIVRPSA